VLPEDETADEGTDDASAPYIHDQSELDGRHQAALLAERKYSCPRLARHPSVSFYTSMTTLPRAADSQTEWSRHRHVIGIIDSALFLKRFLPPTDSGWRRCRGTA